MQNNNTIMGWFNHAKEADSYKLQPSVEVLIQNFNKIQAEATTNPAADVPEKELEKTAKEIAAFQNMNAESEVLAEKEAIILEALKVRFNRRNIMNNLMMDYLLSQ